MNKAPSDDFVYAKSLKKLFCITGSFYELVIDGVIYKCRNRLDIKSKNKNTTTPDIIVIMMNPGSSKSLDTTNKPKRYNISNIQNLQTYLSITRPDNTQYQIMRLMLKQNWQYAIVLNLSDISDANSINFSKTLAKISIKDDNEIHSILSNHREDELNNILHRYKSRYILAGWGNLKNQQKLMKLATKRFENFKIIGIKSDKCEYCYSHPSPQKQELKLKWLKDIDENFSNINK